jgi:hypothetical protein
MAREYPGRFRRYHPGVAADGGSCAPFYDDAVVVDGKDFRVYRCDWGWCVKRGDVAARSRFLIDAFEEAAGTARVDTDVLLRLVAMLERALTEEHRRTGRTASTAVAVPVLGD